MTNADAQKFLKDNGLDVDAIDRRGLLGAFASEMANGLSGKSSTLMMIPSFISIDRPVKTDTPVVVLDAGGTNLRRAVVRIDRRGKVVISDFAERDMPGSKSHVELDEFFQIFADFVEPVMKVSASIGFCFSYAAEITPDRDAILLHWSKEIDAPAVVGKLIGKGLRQQLARKRLAPQITILNDTVATLLAGRSMGVTKNYSAYIGFILGTGTNTAYLEQNSRITKRSDLDPAGSMVINIESGAFGKIGQSNFDRLLDANTSTPGTYVFEKMISGGYLGALGLVVLKEAAKAGFFSAAARGKILQMAELSSEHLGNFCGGKLDPGNPLSDPAIGQEDGEMIRELCTPVFARSAVLTAVNLASAILKTGQGKDPKRPVCVNVDGSTYYKTLAADFQNRVKRELADLVRPAGVAYELVQVDRSPTIGAAVAGLM